MHAFTNTIEVLKSGGKDDYGDPIPGDSFTVSGVIVDPFDGSTENNDRRNQTITTTTIYDPSYSDIGSADTVILNGQRWEVDGDPAKAQSPFTGWSPGQIIKLRKVTG